MTTVEYEKREGSNWFGSSSLPLPSPSPLVHSNPCSRLSRWWGLILRWMAIDLPPSSSLSSSIPPWDVISSWRESVPFFLTFTPPPFITRFFFHPTIAHCRELYHSSLSPIFPCLLRALMTLDLLPFLISIFPRGRAGGAPLALSTRSSQVTMRIGAISSLCCS